LYFSLNVPKNSEIFFNYFEYWLMFTFNGNRSSECFGPQKLCQNFILLGEVGKRIYLDITIFQFNIRKIKENK